MRSAMMYSLEMEALTKIEETKLEMTELKMLGFSLGVIRMDKIRKSILGDS